MQEHNDDDKYKIVKQVAEEKVCFKGKRNKDQKRTENTFESGVCSSIELSTSGVESVSRILPSIGITEHELKP